MFTGMVEEPVEITAVEQLINAAQQGRSEPLITSGAGNSNVIAVSGVCLTVVVVAGAEFTVDIVDETLQGFSLAKVASGDHMNLERATPAGRRLGGHIMQGHVNRTGAFLARAANGVTTFRAARAPRAVGHAGGFDRGRRRVADRRGTRRRPVAVALIPATLEASTLGGRGPGDLVNLEVGMVAKYGDKLAMPPTARPAEQRVARAWRSNHE